ncbi:alpha/beta hydrolase [Stieleria varia]|uniref:Acetylxylan esterase n=1 Tax=Stieleria varia TaxID=2528005 RepID=A0A5C6ALV4_9BACT|nr:alpha/beta hydrolase [Stieleria varia]TWU00995.1 Acetylxylan esterase precursor [Stieleria varia]
MISLRDTCLLFAALVFTSTVHAVEPKTIDVWPDLAPMETSRETGVKSPPRPEEDPPITRLVNIRRPTMDVFLPDNPCGTAVVILPGGGFGKVVPDKEGSEAAIWLNQLGIAAFVLNYRTNESTPAGEPAYLRPLQDAQRAISLVRANANQWNIDPTRVGVLAFSAGGQVGAYLHTATKSAYDAIDEVDQKSWKPDFSLLVYPWQVTDDSGELKPGIVLTSECKPAFIVHTHDDRSTSIGSVLIYAGLKKSGVSAELHIYQNGGHGYGMRSVQGSDIGTWPDRATDWLLIRKLGVR